MRNFAWGGLTVCAVTVLALYAGIADARSSATVFSFSSTPSISTLLDDDHDEIPDDWEALNGLDPASPTDAGLDLDGDGLSALEEFRAGTDPWSADSNLDGWTDGASTVGGPDEPWAADHLNICALRLHQSF